MRDKAVVGQRSNIISFGKRFENLAISVRAKIIGSNTTTFQDHVGRGAIVFLHCKGEIWNYGTVVNDYENSRDLLWPNDIYPFRNKISIEHLTLDPVVLSNGIYNTALRMEFGVGWAYKFIFSPRPLPEKIGQKSYEELKTRKPVSENVFLKAISEGAK